MDRRVLAVTWRVVRDAITHYNNDDGYAIASHVAMSVLLALFPFLIFVTTLAGFLGAGIYAQPAIDLVFASVPDVIAKPIAGEIHAVLSVPRGGLLTVSAVLALYFASNGVEAVRTALNRAYRVQETRTFYWCRVQSLFFIVVAAAGMLSMGLLLILPLRVWPWLHAVLPDAVTYTETLQFWRFAIVFSVLVIVLYMAHLWLPAKRPAMSVLWPGISLTVIFWISGSLTFATYLEIFASYSATYAGLAGVVIALVFLYLMAAILILGAEINTSIGRYRIAGFSTRQADPDAG
ncbi:MAG: YihY/virulence factor BrkB family protein [Pseudomonadota bacterium]